MPGWKRNHADSNVHLQGLPIANSSRDQLIDYVRTNPMRRSTHAASTLRSRVAGLAILAVATLLALPVANSGTPREGTVCIKSTTDVSATCNCNGGTCSVSVSIIPDPFGTPPCPECKWNYSYNISCPGSTPPCASAGGGSITLPCEKEDDNILPVTINCPNTTNPFRTITFKCNQCL